MRRSRGGGTLLRIFSLVLLSSDDFVRGEKDQVLLYVKTS